jgi:hypothetical protein
MTPRVLYLATKWRSLIERFPPGEKSTQYPLNRRLGGLRDGEEKSSCSYQASKSRRPARRQVINFLSYPSS